MDKRRLKSILLTVARRVGIFALCRQVTRNQLRILAYHGAALSDEAEFRGGLFMTAEKFDSRLAFLTKHGYPVLPLEEALAKLEAGNLPSHATVITIDDGWLGTRTIMAPALARHGFPAMLYVSSYYMQTQTQVFNVAAAYILWKSHEALLNLNTLRDELVGEFQLDDAEDCDRATTILWEYANTGWAVPRQALLEDLSAAINVDCAQIVKERVLSYMSTEEAGELDQYGIDVQLHTHRHRFSGESLEAAQREIDENRRALEPAASRPLIHFCYPSGEYEPDQRAWLRQFGIATSTTTQARFNRRGGDVMELGRFLDAEQIEEIEFEAEMSGFYEVLRIMKIR